MLDVKLWMHVGMFDTLLYNQGLAQLLLSGSNVDLSTQINEGKSGVNTQSLMENVIPNMGDEDVLSLLQQKCANHTHGRFFTELKAKTYFSKGK